MVSDENKKKPPTVQLSARVKPGLPDTMKGERLPGQAIGFVWTRAAEIFLQLSSDIRKKILSGPFEDIPGALLVWQYLPTEIREAATQQAKNPESRDDAFWAGFSEGVSRGSQAQAGGRQRKK